MTGSHEEYAETELRKLWATDQDGCRFRESTAKACKIKSLVERTSSQISKQQLVAIGEKCAACRKLCEELHRCSHTGVSRVRARCSFR